MELLKKTLLAFCIAIPLAAAPTVGSLAASPSSIPFGLSTAITVTVQIGGGAVLPNGANLLQVSASSTSATVLGVFHDDGQNGDAIAGDGFYTVVVSFNPTQPGNLLLQASVAFQGILLRVKSAVLSLPVISQTGTPSISDFTPKSGSVGMVINVSLNNFNVITGTTPQVSVPGLNGNSLVVSASSFSATSLAFVIPAGAGSGPFSVTFGQQSATSRTALTVTPSSTFGLQVSPSSVNLLQGQTIDYAVAISSGNGFNGLATLAVSGLPAGVGFAFRPTQITAGQTALLTLTAAKDQPPSASTLTVGASASIEGQTISQTATTNLRVEGVTTAFLGRTVVADNDETPIAGVAIKFLGKDGSGNTTGCSGRMTSDAAGNFALTNLSNACIGPQLISYDGSTATSPAGKYAGVNLVYTLAAGQVTSSPVLIHLPRIDDKETVQVKQNSSTDQVFTFQTIPNLTLTVYAGTTFTLEDGSQPDPFPLIAIDVPIDRLPDKMPSSALVTPFIVAFQPANAVASQPVAVNYPNPLNVPPATHGTLMTLDPTRGLMVPYGTATASPDGTQFIADADRSHPGHNYGLVHFDWHGVATSTRMLANNGCPECVPPPPGATCPPATCALTSSPIDLSSGTETLAVTDVAIGGARGSLTLTRYYRSNNPNDGPLGIGTGHKYYYRIPLGAGGPVFNLFFPDGTSFPFTKIGFNQYASSTNPKLTGAVATTNTDGTITMRWKDGTVWTFASVGGSLGPALYLTSLVDANGNTTTITWTGGNMTQVTDPVGRSLQFVYDSKNHITQVTDPIGRTVKYSYNPEGTLASVTDAEGGVTHYAYDAQNRLASIRDPRDILTVQNVYDANGFVIQQTQADGGVTRFDYALQDPDNPNSLNTQTVVTDALNHSTTYRFSPAGFLLSVTDATGQTRQFTRLPGSNQLAGITGTGSCSLCQNPASGDVSFTYDANGNIASVTDSLNNTTTYVYDPVFNQITSVTDLMGNTTGLAYDPRGNLVSITDPSNNATTFAYDSFGELIRSTDALNNNTSFSYDFGNLIQIIDALNNKTQIAYDPASRPIQISDAFGRSTRTAYDNFDRVVNQTDPSNGVTQFSYDKASNLISLTDSKGNKTSFLYDSMNRLTTRTDPLLESDSRTYDYNSNLITFVDRRTQTSHFGYDGLNRLVSVDYDDGSSVRRNYDANSRLTVVADSLSGSSDFTYDPAGRLLSTVNQFGAVKYDYDQDSRVASRQVAGQLAVQYRYDAASNLVSAAMLNASAAFTYDKDNRLSFIQRPNGVSSQYTYDAAGRLLSILHSSGADLNIPLVYTYDALGNRTGYSTPIGRPLITQAYTSTYNNDNQLTSRTDSSGLTTYSFDATGNLISANNATGSTTYSWDRRNRLTAVSQSDGQRTTFLYDAGVNLLQQIDSGPTLNRMQHCLFDQVTNLAYIENSAGDEQSVLNGLGIDQDLAITYSRGLVEYGLKDAVNSTVAIVDQTGRVKRAFNYEPFGEMTNSTDYPFAFTGRTAVATNLYYYRARFYNAAAGRFISEDPIGLGGGTNLYAYAGNGPIGRRDALGLDWVDWLNGAANFSAGFGDTLTFGLTNHIRNLLGSNGIISTCSTSYHVGSWAGIGVGAIIASELLPGAAFEGTANLSVDYSERVLARMAETAGDPFHNVPTSFDLYTIQNGNIGVLTQRYVQYELGGVINGYQGVYEVGGNWIGNVFDITHRFFRPF